jgi:hypothetical protein
MVYWDQSGVSGRVGLPEREFSQLVVHMQIGSGKEYLAQKRYVYLLTGIYHHRSVAVDNLGNSGIDSHIWE